MIDYKLRNGGGSTTGLDFAAIKLGVIINEIVLYYVRFERSYLIWAQKQ